MYPSRDKGNSGEDAFFVNNIPADLLTSLKNLAIARHKLEKEAQEENEKEASKVLEQERIKDDIKKIKEDIKEIKPVMEKLLKLLQTQNR